MTRAISGRPETPSAATRSRVSTRAATRSTTPTSRKSSTLPLDFSRVERLHYVPATDTLYVTGFRPGQSDDGCWGQVGKSLARYERFATRRPAKQFQIDIPSNCDGLVVPKAMDIAGDAIFIVDVSSGGHGTGLLRVYDAKTGASNAVVPRRSRRGRRHLQHRLDRHPLRPPRLPPRQRPVSGVRRRRL